MTVAPVAAYHRRRNHAAVHRDVILIIGQRIDVLLHAATVAHRCVERPTIPVRPHATSRWWSEYAYAHANSNADADLLMLLLFGHRSRSV